MSDAGWRTVVIGLQEFINGPTDAQLDLAGRIGLALNPSTPQPVATVLMRRHMQGPLRLPTPGIATEGQLEYLHDLAEQTASPEPADTGDRDIVDAWIAVMHAHRAVIHLDAVRYATVTE